MNKLVIFCIFLSVCHLACAFHKIHIQSIVDINLYKDRYTIGFKPVKQQQCVLDYAGLCSNFAPSYIKCLNIGSSGNNVIWRCQAQLDKRVAFDLLHVSCEVWPGENPASGWVVEGSCSLDYNLKRA